MAPRTEQMRVDVSFLEVAHPIW